MGIVILVLVLALLVIFGVAVLYRKRGFSRRDQEFFSEKWGVILEHSRVNPTKSVLDADKLLDHAMRKKGFSGTLGEKLKRARNYFSDIHGLWEAHKLRNRIAHEVGYEVNHQKASDALGKFKKAFHDLGLKL
jgi:hypothetical protein